MKKALRISILLILAVFVAGLFGQPVRAATTFPVDLARARLSLDDLPPGFEVAAGIQAEDNLSLFTTVWEPFLEPETGARLLNLDAFQSETLGEQQWVIAALLAPLSDAEQATLQSLFSDPALLLERMDLVSGETFFLTGEGGMRSLEFASVRVCGETSIQIEFVVSLRGDVLELVAFIHPWQSPVQTSASSLAAYLDHRVGVEVAVTQGAYRLPGPLSPRFTTYIPTPLEISRNADAFVTNSIFAIFTVMIFAVGVEAFSQTLDGGKLTRGYLWINDRTLWLREGFVRLFRRWPRALRFIGILLFYGLVFSLIDVEWSLFTVRGIFVLVSMILAYAIVGLLDDYRGWYISHRDHWEAKPDLELRSRDFLLAIVSVAVTRCFGFQPGLFFGSPEVLGETKTLSEARRQSLLKIRLNVLVFSGLACYLATMLTHWLQGSVLRGNLADLAAAIETVLLIISAVALENVFAQSIGFPGTLGWELKQSRRGIWRYGILAVSGLAFFHILVNPFGEWVQAMNVPNVRVVLFTELGFSFVAFLLYFLPFLYRGQAGKRKWGKLVAALSLVVAVFVMLIIPQTPEDEAAGQVQPDSIQAAASGLIPLPENWTEEETQPVLPAQSEWPLLWQTTFTGTETGWETGQLEGSSASVSAGISYGVYRLEFTPEEGGLVLFRETSAPPVSDFFMDVDVRQLECPADAEIGLLFRFQDEDNFYYLGINSLRELWVEVRQDGVWSELLDGKRVDAFQPCAWNRISILAEGNDFQVFVNAEFAAQFSDDRIPSGGLALGGWLARPEETAVFEFDTIELRTP